MKLEGVNAGDIVTRMLGGPKGVPMKLKVLRVDETFIHCGALDAPIDGWKFLLSNGAEVDEDLGWDGITKTGSIITQITTP